jgi:hypothetical protein
MKVRNENINIKKFLHDCLDLVNSKYVWGGREVGSVDCSGTLRFALNKQGYNFNNYTADRFFKEVFTEDCQSGDEANSDIIKAVFYITKTAYRTPTGEIRPAGIARHVTPVVGDYVVLHADYNRGVILKTAKSVRQMYEDRNCIAVWRRLP